LMMTWAEKTMSKVILGGTLTSQADGKSSTNALGNVHNEVRQELRDSDLAQIAETLTRDLVAPLYALNCKSYQSHRRHPRLVFDTTESEDLRALAYPLRAFVSMGMQIPQQWLHEKTRIPKPANGEAVLAIQEEQPGQSVETALAALAAKDAAKDAAKNTVETRAEARAEATATQTEAIAARDNTDKLIDQLATNAAPLMAQLMSPVADAVLSATSLVELRQQIQGLETELDSSALEKQMQLAIAAAYLLGQVELEEGD
jgi:phage gp29-like protein